MNAFARLTSLVFLSSSLLFAQSTQQTPAASNQELPASPANQATPGLKLQVFAVSIVQKEAKTKEKQARSGERMRSCSFLMARVSHRHKNWKQRNVQRFIPQAAEHPPAIRAFQAPAATAQCP